MRKVMLFLAAINVIGSIYSSSSNKDKFERNFSICLGVWYLFLLILIGRNRDLGFWQWVLFGLQACLLALTAFGCFVIAVPIGMMALVMIPPILFLAAIARIGK